jgi:RNA polymerase sigma factor (TIGR02999 family)
VVLGHWARTNAAPAVIAFSMHDITLILQAAQRGDDGAAERLMNAVYEELRRLAATKLARECNGHTLQPTALVHEAWLRLGGDHQPAWNSRSHFFAASAEAMRRILIERARHRRALRHGGDQQRVELDGVDLVADVADDDRLLAVNEALDRFATVDAPAAELVKMHYFAGLSMKEAATALDISESTAWRRWHYARAWLFRELNPR